MKTKFLMLSLILVLFTSCGSISKKMETWVGSSKNQLYKSWGPPTRVTDDGSGGEILIYEKYINFGQQPGQIYNSNGRINYTTPQQNGYLRQRMFYVNNSGYIYSWRAVGY